MSEPPVGRNERCVTPWSKFYLFATGDFFLQMFLLQAAQTAGAAAPQSAAMICGGPRGRFALKVAGICIRMERAEPGRHEQRQGEVRSTGTWINGDESSERVNRVSSSEGERRKKRGIDKTLEMLNLPFIHSVEEGS